MQLPRDTLCFNTHSIKCISQRSQDTKQTSKTSWSSQWFHTPCSPLFRLVLGRGNSTIWSETGWHQGDPLVSLLFAVELHPIVLKIKEEVSHS